MLSFIKFGPGGIRTHDQRIMSPLRYRCATGPLCATFLFNFQTLSEPGLALAKLSFALPNFARNVTFSHFSHSVATGPLCATFLFNFQTLSEPGLALAKLSFALPNFARNVTFSHLSRSVATNQ